MESMLGRRRYGSLGDLFVANVFLGRSVGCYMHKTGLWQIGAQIFCGDDQVVVDQSESEEAKLLIYLARLRQQDLSAQTHAPNLEPRAHLKLAASGAELSRKAISTLERGYSLPGVASIIAGKPSTKPDSIVSYRSHTMTDAGEGIPRGFS
jgi:hypothetical protein